MRLIILFFFLITNLHAQWTRVNCETVPKTWGVCNFIEAVDSNQVFFTLNNVPKPFYYSSDAGKTWSEIYTPDSWGPLVITIQSQSTWASSDTKVYYSENMGKDWVIQADLSSKTSFIDYLKMFDNNNGIIIGGAPSDSKPLLILKTSDGGKNWLQIPNTLIGAQTRDQFFPIDFIDSLDGYYSDNTTDKLFKTTDGGYNWTEINYPAKIIFMIRFYNKDLGILMSQSLSLSIPNRLYRTIDAGNSWKELPLETKSSGWHHDIEFLPGDPSKVWFTDYDKLYFSSDTGSTWKEYKIMDGILQGRNIKFTDQNHGWLLCDEGKLFHTTNNGAVATEVQKEVSYSITSLETYPNPFNPSTTIEYTVEKYGLVQLSIFDILGNEIYSLINEEKPAGRYQVTFDASNLSAGIYLCQLRTGKILRSKKLLYLK